MKVCPRCGSKKVDWLNPEDAAVWECKNCNYTGPIIERNNKKRNKKSLSDIKIIRKL